MKSNKDIIMLTIQQNIIIAKKQTNINKREKRKKIK